MNYGLTPAYSALTLFIAKSKANPVMGGQGT